jgi:pyruvate dehydrogenase E2 component (dihydrolipoamide acetyltransferase)
LAQREIRLPDIGEFEDVEVIEVLVSAGERVEVEQSLIVLESDKASMEIPSPWAGVITEIRVSVGDAAFEQMPIGVMEVDQKDDAPPASAPRVETREDEPVEAAAAVVAAPAADTPSAADMAPYTVASELPHAHASPSVRRLARELGVDLRLVPGSGRKGRIQKEDLQGYVKATLRHGSSAGGVPIAGVNVAAPVEIDYSKFGPTEVAALNRIRKISAANLHRSWVTVPHVTQFDDADVTELEEFRRARKGEAEERGLKLTFLPFIVKACVAALRQMPQFNASLDAIGENLVLKHYFHIGVAVDTERGLIVPVLKDADRKGLFEMAAELQELSARARDRKLRPEHLQGGSFSISSLGGIGGTKFTPIVNHPEVAILGVSRMEWRPVYRDGGFVPRRILPLSLSYDHRVIDGADAARFTRLLAEYLSDMRRILL